MSTQLKPYIEGPKPYSPEWFAMRSSVFGASEAAALCGESDYKTPLELYLQKRGLADDIEETKRMRLGLKLQPINLSEYAIVMGIPETALIQEPPMRILIDRPHIVASLDAERIDEADPFPVEAKSTNFHMAGKFGEEGTDEIPTDHVMQAQQQMAVSGAAKCHVSVFIDAFTLKVYVVHRNQTIIDCIFAAADEMRERIINCDPPEPTWTHPSTNKLVKNLYDIVDCKEIDLSFEASALWQRRKAINEQINALKKEAEQLQSQVMYAMYDANVAILPDGEKVLVRRVQNRAGYTVEPTSYVELRELKADSKSRPKRLPSPPEVKFFAELEAATLALTHRGAELIDVSPHQSRYLKTPGGLRIRVSNHEPNIATDKWMERQDVAGIRVDLPGWQDQLKAITGPIDSAAGSLVPLFGAAETVDQSPVSQTHPTG